MTDQQEIYDRLVCTSRDNDHFYEERIVGSYHPDGLHELGSKFIPAPDHGKFAHQGHAAICDINMYTVTMHSCDIGGDVAHAGSYVIGLFADRGGETSRILAGRCLDRLEKRNGERW